ncbi:UDP-N-acetylglucosamine--N-acetylmuramyl-(pentapeptide) pyrophosphoryl-undecaprenol N-acetylglucosamine transferase [Amnibacterium sp. CER49]|uniref:UDP-N-acetylglucosamine--N-acetylmuramyl- (pentapeptide) pyrophosphoryl-undecaprenol N-acetylglucosamine transferase n=1 Tax=Amnibacterium sp. CER49 TaxID=3039161 RepID=UPI00244A0A85|nr:UDP-N-acetylglucosamine--N-acetylmuramyl-(pentapeptide) pyrophosphoryl-undecaprenol N-acetylglucosamine transferase [Amnibacterium sp. CER49]MDH2444704.1 UDP-N-acetylglucosamine--N-acetylmuramyl-(pentapeptide) pyrophosphoryl-undecaprenol N-acetylglucosamine transferase [Amnibacterium sp. CER49]
MTTWLLAGGGTAGHVNPLLAVADELTAQGDDVLVLGTAEGLEARLVPSRGYELLVIPRLPFPRRLDAAAVRFPRAVLGSIATTAGHLADRGVDAVIGFGGYAAAPAYLAARRRRVPIAVHEQNAKPGLANRLGARLTTAVGVTFDGTPLPHAEVVGMPLRREIAALDRAAVRGEALRFFDLAADRPVLLVTGGSLGADRINRAVTASARAVLDAGWQVLHLAGSRGDVDDPGLPGYRMLQYADRMDLALAVADLAVSRAGASTVSELSALGIPAVYVPYPVGNGEQRFNAAGVVRAGGALLVDDADFTPEAVRNRVLPLLASSVRLTAMTEAAQAGGVRDGAVRMTRLARTVLGDGARVGFGA